MGNEQQDHHPSEQSNSSRLLAELQEKCARLQQVIQQLQEEKKRDAEALAAAHAELKEYQHLLCNLMAEQWTEEVWRDFKEEDYNITAEELIEELERQEGS